MIKYKRKQFTTSNTCIMNMINNMRIRGMALHDVYRFTHMCVTVLDNISCKLL